MAITVNLRYSGKNGAARKFAEEMSYYTLYQEYGLLIL